MTELAERLCHCDLAEPCPLGRERAAATDVNRGGRCSMMMHGPGDARPSHAAAPHFTAPEPQTLERVEDYVVRTAALLERFVNDELIPWLSEPPPPR